MPKIIDAQLAQLRFPTTCAVCMSPAINRYEQEENIYIRTQILYSNRRCADVRTAFRRRQLRGFRERLVGTLGIIVGLIIGLISMGMLILHWQGTRQGNIVLNGLLGGMVGLGMFLIAWAAISLSVAPLFADPASKEARNAVQITQYWPNDKFVRLRFEQEQLAEIVQRMSS